MAECFIGGVNKTDEKLVLASKGGFQTSTNISIYANKRYKLHLLDVAGNMLLAYIENGIAKEVYNNPWNYPNGVKLTVSSPTSLHVETNYYNGVYNLTEVI